MYFNKFILDEDNLRYNLTVNSSFDLWYPAGYSNDSTWTSHLGHTVWQYLYDVPRSAVDCMKDELRQVGRYMTDQFILQHPKELASLAEDNLLPFILGQDVEYLTKKARADYDENLLSELSELLPGQDKALSIIQVKAYDMECDCYDVAPIGRKPYTDELSGWIVHFNDEHNYTREAIADWLDRLHDARVVNLEFKVDATTQV